MKNLLALFFLSISFSVFSQQDYVDIIARETCECVNAKKIDLTKASEVEVQAALGVCMITSYSTYKDKMNPEDKVEFGDSGGMEKLGEKVGLKMLNHCPELIMKLGSALDEEKNSAVPNLIIEGEFVSVKQGDFVALVVKDNSGRIHNLLLLNHFQNAEWITNNELKKNQKISVTYNDHEFYDPKSKDYKHFKVLYGINKI